MIVPAGSESTTERRGCQDGPAVRAVGVRLFLGVCTGAALTILVNIGGSSGVAGVAITSVRRVRACANVRVDVSTVLPQPRAKRPVAA